ncbi:hypothetical protein N7510_000879 [Penicillium lagena]|uniref:uncharacterized protein n=1 Tax=Penicillium lagena TaxID=94218 RepID=UPI0025416642|nr:uncharacterized protein N7510_000879 [Penicillium lagena]KAJ5624570.1 hypothetical protein N7510_000879 [Penicillium lagena]
MHKELPPYLQLGEKISFDAKMLVDCLQREERFPETMTDPPGLIAVTIGTDLLSIYKSRLITITAKLCNLQAAIREGYPQEATYILSIARAIDSELMEIANMFVASFPYKTVKWTESHPNNMFESLHIAHFDRRFHVYTSTEACDVWNKYRCARIIVNRLIFMQLHRLERKSRDSSNHSSYKSQLPEIESLLKHLAIEICSSVPFQLGIAGRRKDSLPFPEMIKPAAGFTLLFPLYLAATVDGYPDPTCLWVMTCLNFFGRFMEPAGPAGHHAIHRTLLDAPMATAELIGFRSSRSGRHLDNPNRTRNGQIDHDVFEGLPVRRWSRQPHTFSQAPKPAESEIGVKGPGGTTGLPELPMPRDSQLLPAISHGLLRAARAGCIYIHSSGRPADDEKNDADDQGATSAVHMADRSFTTRKWMTLPKHMEPAEPEFLAKRRQGLPSLYGGAALTEGANASVPMRRTKFKKVDSETGKISIYEAWVPEGHTIEGEITGDAKVVAEQSDAPVSSEAPAPGTVVDGVGVVNSEGVVVADASSAALSTHKRRPPPPKRKGKGIGKGRKKKVMFAPGEGADAALVHGAESGAADGGKEGTDGDEEGEEGEESDEGDESMVDAKTPETPQPPPGPESADQSATEAGTEQPPATSDIDMMDATPTAQPPAPGPAEQQPEETAVSQAIEEISQPSIEAPTVPTEEAKALDSAVPVASETEPIFPNKPTPSPEPTTTAEEPAEKVVPGDGDEAAPQSIAPEADGTTEAVIEGAPDLTPKEAENARSASPERPVEETPAESLTETPAVDEPMPTETVDKSPEQTSGGHESEGISTPPVPQPDAPQEQPSEDASESKGAALLDTLESSLDKHAAVDETPVVKEDVDMNDVPTEAEQRPEPAEILAPVQPRSPSLAPVAATESEPQPSLGEPMPADSAVVDEPAPAIEGETSTGNDKGEEATTTASEADVKEAVETEEEQKPASESQPAPIDSA